MSIDFNAITAYAALMAAGTAIYAVWIEGKRSRFAHGIDTLFKLIDQFEGEKFREKRRMVARTLLEKKITENEIKWQNSASEIMDHFEMVAILLQKKVIDLDLTYAEYMYWLDNYYFLLHDLVDYFRHEMNDQTQWEDVYWLRDQFIKHEKKYGGYTPPNEYELHNFLIYEVHI